MTDLSAHHVGITVADLDRAVDFYAGTLGLDVVAEFSVSGDAFADAVAVPGATGSFTHLDADGVRVELVEYDPAADARADAALNEPGAVHVGFAVDDLDAFHAGLDDDVVTLSAPRTTESGTRICFVRDPEGNLVEVLET
ncbi:VOC family protein [Halorubrum sp. JWXQ-INN 858]|uniref:VOC family protein n=1 Tax=Halorubrum sp. JWXQ-INN 858 TaxID=2690782 RepID=UPI001358B93B|nr:VOC family protein [Halorubrum sp. JWXQ-INN 858]MWV64312.1 VOC family protein [Halorubrum sp. JWXQ-INN 858]